MPTNLQHCIYRIFLFKPSHKLMHRKPTEHEKFCMLNMQQTLELRDKYRWPLITWFLLKGQLLDDQL